jgi:hypothetical protein
MNFRRFDNKSMPFAILSIAEKAHSAIFSVCAKHTLILNENH